MIAALSIGLVILIGGIDLSVGSILILTGVITANIINLTDNTFLSILVALVFSTILGLINGAAIGMLKLNFVIVTLATMQAYRSLADVISNKSPIRISNENFNYLGSGYIELDNIYELPIVIFPIIGIYILFSYLLKNNIFFRKIKLIGSNKDTARISGINVNLNTMWTYSLSGSLIGIATVIDTGRVMSVHPMSGLNLEFDAITAVIIGGASLKGGVLNISSTFLGVLIVGCVVSGLSLMNIQAFYVKVLKGCILLAAIILNQILERK